jgi:hypothetical protein
MNFPHATLVCFLHAFAFRLCKSFVSSSHHSGVQGLFRRCHTKIRSSSFAVGGHQRPFPPIENETQRVIFLVRAFFMVLPQSQLACLRWVIEMEELRRWRVADDRRYSFLWINGLPGIGKSNTTTFLVDLLKAQNSELVFSSARVKKSNFKSHWNNRRPAFPYIRAK